MKLLQSVFCLLSVSIWGKWLYSASLSLSFSLVFLLVPSLPPSPHNQMSLSSTSGFLPEMSRVLAQSSWFGA